MSIIREPTCTDQQVIFWVTTAQWTLIEADKLPLVSLDLLSVAARDFFYYLFFLCMFEQKRYQKAKREREMMGSI